MYAAFYTVVNRRKNQFFSSIVCISFLDIRQTQIHRAEPLVR